MSATCGCSRPVHHGYVICDTCKKDLEQHLAEMAWLDDQLTVSLTRAKGIDYNRQAGRSAETPLPWNDKAAQARHALKAELVGWVRHIAASRDAYPHDDLVSIAAWLMSRLERIAKRDDAQVIHDTITDASQQARAVVFAKPLPRDYIGPCEGAITDEDGEISETECVGEIFLIEGASIAECDECGRAYDPDDAIRARDKKLADRLMTATEIATLAHRTFGQPIEKVRKLVVSWHRRGRLAAHSADQAGAPLFRHEDAHNMLARTYGEVS